MKADTSVLWLTIGGREVASSRVRAFYLSDALRLQGVRSRCVVAAGIRGRIRAVVALLLLGRAPVIVVQKILFGALMLRCLRWRASVLVWECDDALHLGYPASPASKVVEERRRVELVLSSVDVVTTSNPLLATELRPASGRVNVLLGPAPPPALNPTDRERVLLWLGSPSTEPYLALLRDVPRRLREAGWECVALGATAGASRFGWRAVRWSRVAQEQWLSRATVGVMPQPSDPWADRKQAYKLYEYMAHGVVPVASDVLPARLAMSDACLRPFLLDANADWVRAIVHAARVREDLVPCFLQVLDRRSVESSLTRWREAVASGAER
jgi:hypothetical protein